MNARYLSLGLVSLALLATLGCAPQKSEAEQAAEALDRGLQAHGEGRLDDAATAYREVLVHEPTNKFAFYNLGLIDQTLGRPDAAEANYRLALSVDPNFASALFNLAILRNEAGATEEAIELYRHVLALQPDNAGAHLNIGLALRAVGQEAEAQEHLALAVALDPNLGPRVPTSVTETPIAMPSTPPTP